LGRFEFKKRQKPTYLDTCAEWDVIQSYKTITVPLLKNGSISNSVRIKDKYVSVKEICAFAALTQLIMHACSKEPKYKDELQAVEHSFVHYAQILSSGEKSFALIIFHVHQY